MLSQLLSSYQNVVNELHQMAFRLFMVIVERDLVPDFIIRRGIRYLLSLRLREVRCDPLCTLSGTFSLKKGNTFTYS
jgi:hypothetical protein